MGNDIYGSRTKESLMVNATLFIPNTFSSPKQEVDHLPITGITISNTGYHHTSISIDDVFPLSFLFHTTAVLPFDLQKTFFFLFSSSIIPFALLFLAP